MATVAKKKYKIIIHIFFILLCLLYVLPLWLVVSISFSSEASITANNSGYSLIPKDFSTEAYKLAFQNPQSMVSAYWITASQAILGTVLSCIVAGMVAYPLSRTSFAYKKPITFLIFFTMLFGGGMIPTYIIYTNWYHLLDTYWIYILPGLAGGAWNTLVIRTFFKGLPESLFESAKIDGARELIIFFKIAVPLSTPVFATIGFMTLVGKWNDWNTSLIYIRSSSLYTLQYLLQRILNETAFLKNLMQNSDMAALAAQVGGDSAATLPAETLKYALCVIAAGPMLVVFTFFQKSFASGLTIGAVTG